MSIFFWDDHDRVEYPLTADSIVFDVGGYAGNWTSQIWDKYHCNIHVFEPVVEFANIIKGKFSGNLKIYVHPYGLGAKNELMKMHIAGDRSSIHDYLPGAKEGYAEILGAVPYIESLGIKRIDLMKINIEGGEYDLMEHFIRQGWTKYITDIQIQFHDFVPDANTRADNIRDELKLTHHLTYNYVPYWENWRLT